MVDKIHYRWDFIGLSTDSKPTPAESPKVVDGSTFYESNTSKLYVFYKDTWYEKTATGGGSDITVVQTTGQSTTDVMSQKAVTDALGGAGGGATILTTADYNWPADNPDGVAMWKMPTGYYAASSTNPVKIYITDSFSYTADDTNFAVMVTSKNNGVEIIQWHYSISSQIATYADVYIVRASDGHQLKRYTLKSVVDNLTSTSTDAPLSANQGKVLNDKFGGMQLVSLTQSAYDALTTKDPNTLYIITGA